MSGTACEEAYRPPGAQRASRKSGPRLGRTSPTALKAALGPRLRQQERLQPLEFRAAPPGLLGGHKPGTAAVVPLQLSTANFIKTSMSGDARGTGKGTETKEILTSGGT